MEHDGLRATCGQFELFVCEAERSKGDGHQEEALHLDPPPAHGIHEPNCHIVP